MDSLYSVWCLSAAVKDGDESLGKGLVVEIAGVAVLVAERFPYDNRCTYEMVSCKLAVGGNSNSQLAAHFAQDSISPYPHTFGGVQHR